MTRKRPSSKGGRKRAGAGRRLPRVGGWVSGGLVAAAIVVVAVVVINGAGGGKGSDDFTPDIKETRSQDAATAFQGGPRLNFPVDAIDMGRVPLNTEVSYAFAMTNVGDTAAHIEDVDVSILEGC